MAGLVAAALPCLGHPADAYPSRPLRVLVGFPPGGPVDVQARIVMQKLSDVFRQSIVIDNRAGADGAIANETVAKSSPDGYTLLYGGGGHVINTIVRGKASIYDAINDFEPVGLLTNSSYLLVSHPSLAATSLHELVALAKARPGSLSYASSGSGSTPHLAAEYFRTLARIELVHVPYKGAVPGLNDVLGGQIPLTIVGPPPALPHVRSGRIRALAATGARRLASVPDVPTIAESGYPGYDVAAWYGFFAPAKTPAAIVERLNRELVAIIRTPAVSERLVSQGLDPVGSTPAQHMAHLRGELERWTPIVRAAGMRID